VAVRSRSTRHLPDGPRPMNTAAGPPVGSGVPFPPVPSGLSAPLGRTPGPVGSSIVAPFPMAGEQTGKPLALLGGQVRHEIGEGVGTYVLQGVRPDPGSVDRAGRAPAAAERRPDARTGRRPGSPPASSGSAGAVGS